MTPVLTFSSIDNGEIPVLLHSLDLKEKVTVNEVVARASLSLDGETCPRKIIDSLASLSAAITPKTDAEKVLYEQWISFALNVAKKELGNSHAFDSTVLAPLHVSLERRAFLLGTFEPSVVDWLLFSMLFPQIVQQSVY